MYLHNKLEKSSPIFANTKVASCSGVLMSNGLSVAMPFKTGNSTQRLIPVHAHEKLVSVTHDQFKVRDNHHAGMIRKPLEPYHPLAYRSRLPSPTVVMPHKNSSQIIIGDRSFQDRNHYATIHKSMHHQPKAFETLNTGIIADLTARNKRKINI